MRRARQQGFVLGMVMGVIALLSVIAAAITLSGRSTIHQVQRAADAQNIYVQAQLIRTKILKCSFDYPAGDNSTGIRPALPGAALADAAVSALNCPGAPAGTNALWSGQDAVFLPNVPNGFGAWQYRNDGTSARITIQANSDEGLTALSGVQARFSTQETSLDATTRTLTLVLQT